MGRATPLYEAERLTAHYRRADGGPRIWLKREDLNHTGAHKINNALGQALLALRMGKKRVIAETGVVYFSMPMTPKACHRILECLEICTLVHGGEDLPPWPRTPARLSEAFSGTKESPILMTPRRQPR